MLETLLKLIARSHDVAFIKSVKTGVYDAYNGNFHFFNGEYTHVNSFHIDAIRRAADARVAYLDSPLYAVTENAIKYPEYFQDFITILKAML
jgi:ATPase subunit of ABC transporter with duplicated ATPase domains